jgi:hypothetical protein
VENCLLNGVACSQISALDCCAGFECVCGDPPLFNGVCRRECVPGARRCAADSVSCCPADRACCNGVCCPFGQHCIGGACGCINPGATCDPNNNVCCQFEETFCIARQDAAPGIDSEKCCRPLGGSCDRSHDATGDSDCCINSYAGPIGNSEGPCGDDGICGGFYAVCSGDDRCVSGVCLGRCNNQFPIKYCREHAECDCEGDLDDGCVQRVGFCRYKRCR